MHLDLMKTADACSRSSGSRPGESKSLPPNRDAAHRCAGSVASSPQGSVIKVASLGQAGAI
jgi:hypothetical protein